MSGRSGEGGGEDERYNLDEIACFWRAFLSSYVSVSLLPLYFNRFHFLFLSHFIFPCEFLSCFHWLYQCVFTSFVLYTSAFEDIAYLCVYTCVSLSQPIFSLALYHTQASWSDSVFVKHRSCQSICRIDALNIESLQLVILSRITLYHTQWFTPITPISSHWASALPRELC